MGRRGRVLILYASETGNAHDCAELLGRQAKARGFSSIRVLPADSYLSTIEQLPNEDVLVCVASTTGQGEFPRNGREFWRFLRRKSLPATLLQSVRYAVFGLGDSGYPKYNYCAKLLSKRFETLGGHSVVPLGLGDDQHAHGYDASLDIWMPKLWESLDATEVLDVRGLELSPKFDVRIVSVDTGRGPSIARGGVHEVGELVRQLESPFDDALRERTLVSAEVVDNNRMTPPDWFQDTRLVKLDVPQSEGLSLNPGDALAIWPKQDLNAVNAVLDACNLRYDDVVRLQLCDAGSPRSFDGTDLNTASESITCKAGHLLEGLVDVQGAPPRRTFIQVLAQLCPAEAEAAMYKDRLIHLASAQGREDFYEYVMQEGRNLVEVLADFSCVPITIEWILSFAPRLQCRYYSIASAVPVEEREVSATAGTPTTVKMTPVDLLAAMVQWKTPGRRLRRGLCSKTIASLSNGDRITVHIARGDLKPPAPTVPMILVGPGTGIAPLRAFLQDRLQLIDRGIDVAKSILFYGCRDRTKDFYFANEWDDMVHSGVLREVVLATSRETSPKQYVQHVLKERGDIIREMILELGAHIYVCGRADSMPTEVERVLGEILGGDRKLLSKRLHVECWS